MADDTTDTTTPPSAAGMDPALLQRLLGQLTAAPPPAPPQPSASSHEGRGFLSLLGEALGGGQQYGSTAEREQGGLAAAQALGARMMQASDWSYQPHTLGSIIGQGYGAARESLGQTQAVSAARAAAAYDQQRQGQQDQLARLKEAIPLLTLQQQQAAGANAARIALGGSGGGGGSIGTAGGGGSVEVPAEYLPFYQEASARTGIPVEILIAQHKQESGFNPGATGAAGEIGIGQISPKTAADPGYGLTGIKNPAQLRDPRTNINFAADYFAAKAKANGADFSTPEGIAKALKLYNGGGDPNYVQNVLRYVPGAKTTASAPPPGALPPRVQVAGPGAGNLPTPPIPPASAAAHGAWRRRIPRPARRSPAAPWWAPRPSRRHRPPGLAASAPAPAPPPLAPPVARPAGGVHAAATDAVRAGGDQL